MSAHVDMASFAKRDLLFSESVALLSGAGPRRNGAGGIDNSVPWCFRAFFYTKAVRPVYVKLPAEDLEPGDENKCGNLLMSMYGTRDAALNWVMKYGETLRAARYVQGRANPRLFHNKALGVSIMVHGDHFFVFGLNRHLVATEKTLEDKYKLKVAVLGR